MIAALAAEVLAPPKTDDPTGITENSPPVHWRDGGAPNTHRVPEARLNQRAPTTLADALKSLKQGVARRLVGDADHFWQKRYYDFNVRNEAQFVEKLHYIHSNPVNAGLCGRPEDWPWSSFLHHVSGCEGRVDIESEWTARKRERAPGNLCPAVELPHSSQWQA